MRSKQTELFRFLAAIAAAVTLLAGCTDSGSPTAPEFGAPPQERNIGGAWTGTYITSGGDIDCFDARGTSLPAQASFHRNGSTVVGTLTATGPCGFDYTFRGTLEGNTLTGGIDGAPFSSSAHGILTGATLDITVFNSCGCPGDLHLRR